MPQAAEQKRIYKLEVLTANSTRSACQFRNQHSVTCTLHKKGGIDSSTTFCTSRIRILITVCGIPEHVSSEPSI